MATNTLVWVRQCLAACNAFLCVVGPAPAFHFCYHTWAQLASSCCQPHERPSSMYGISLLNKMTFIHHASLRCLCVAWHISPIASQEQTFLLAACVLRVACAFTQPRNHAHSHKSLAPLHWPCSSYAFRCLQMGQFSVTERCICASWISTCVSPCDSAKPRYCNTSEVCHL